MRRSNSTVQPHGTDNLLCRRRAIGTEVPRGTRSATCCCRQRWRRPKLAPTTHCARRGTSKTVLPCWTCAGSADDRPNWTVVAWHTAAGQCKDLAVAVIHTRTLAHMHSHSACPSTTITYLLHTSRCMSTSSVLIRSRNSPHYTGRCTMHPSTQVCRRTAPQHMVCTTLRRISCRSLRDTRLPLQPATSTLAGKSTLLRKHRSTLPW